MRNKMGIQELEEIKDKIDTIIQFLKVSGRAELDLKQYGVSTNNISIPPYGYIDLDHLLVNLRNYDIDDNIIQFISKYFDQTENPEVDERIDDIYSRFSQISNDEIDFEQLDVQDILSIANTDQVQQIAALVLDDRYYGSNAGIPDEYKNFVNKIHKKYN